MFDFVVVVVALSVIAIVGVGVVFGCVFVGVVVVGFYIVNRDIGGGVGIDAVVCVFL